jgi:hypothetical protein
MLLQIAVLSLVMQLSFVRYDVSFKLVHRLSFRILYHLYMCKIYTGNFHLQNSPAIVRNQLTPFSDYSFYLN